MLNATATACVFKFCQRNPKMIKRWLSHVTATRRTRSTILDEAGQPRLNGKLSGRSRKFVGAGAGLGAWVVAEPGQVDGAGGVEGFLRRAGMEA
jgi:hypothetical protein